MSSVAALLAQVTVACRADATAARLETNPPLPFGMDHLRGTDWPPLTRQLSLTRVGPATYRLQSPLQRFVVLTASPAGIGTAVHLGAGVGKLTALPPYGPADESTYASTTTFALPWLGTSEPGYSPEIGNPRQLRER